MPYTRKWTPEEDRILVQAVPWRPIDEIAGSLHRSPKGCLHRLASLGLPSPRTAQKWAKTLSPGEFGAIFGVVQQNVTGWIKASYVRSETIGNVRRKYHRIQEPEVYRFIRDCPARYELALMPESKYRRYAEREAGKRRTDLLTTAQVANRTGCPVSTVRNAIHAGRLPAQHIGGSRMEWWVTPEDAERWRPDPVLMKAWATRRKARAA